MGERTTTNKSSRLLKFFVLWRYLIFIEGGEC